MEGRGGGVRYILTRTLCKESRVRVGFHARGWILRVPCFITKKKKVFSFLLPGIWASQDGACDLFIVVVAFSLAGAHETAYSCFVFFSRPEGGIALCLRVWRFLYVCVCVSVFLFFFISGQPKGLFTLKNKKKSLPFCFVLLQSMITHLETRMGNTCSSSSAKVRRLPSFAPQRFYVFYRMATYVRLSRVGV